MKFRMIEKLCKEQGVVYLYDEDQVDDEVRPRQWMGDGFAIYPLDGMPYLYEDGVAAIFDLSGKKREEMIFKHKTELPSGICLDDTDREEIQLEQYNMRLTVGGDELVMLRGCDDRLVCILRKYLSPFEKNDEIELFRRVTEQGNVFVAVKIGCILRGVISEYMPTNERFVETLGSIYNAAAVALSREKGEAEQLKAKLDG